MKTAAIDSTEIATRSNAVLDFAELVKARLTLLVLLTTAVGFYLGVIGPIPTRLFLNVMLGTSLVAAAAAALNQWWERRLDALMQRTRERPIPAGRMSARRGFLVGIVLAFVGVAYLALTCNWLSAFLAAITIAIYIFAYTPLKRITTANTLVGAIPGALPPVIGWAAARGNVQGASWSLFAILFCWQMPHFFAIAWMYREDYARGGFQMLSRDDDSGVRSASQGVLFSMLLLILSGIPTYIGLTTWNYLPIALTLGGWFVVMALRFHQRKTRESARALFLT
ncbi:MAG: heme o synthase, partial [Verrucomicrobiota bacterium]|nr:heme o synthase [Verrucomicrobiota bacterium]